MSNTKCNCEAKLLTLEKEIKELREEFEAAQAYTLELIDNLALSIDYLQDENLY